MRESYRTENEEWIAIADFEGLYEVSSLGRVRSLRIRNRNVDRLRVSPLILWIPMHLAGKHYPSVTLRKNGKTCTRTVHSLVANAFCHKGRPEFIVAHLNGDKYDNRSSNLSWVTCKENESHKWLHGTRALGEQTNSARLTESQVREIRARYIKGKNMHLLAMEYGVCDTTILDTVKRRRWAHISEEDVQHGA